MEGIAENKDPTKDKAYPANCGINLTAFSDPIIALNKVLYKKLPMFEKESNIPFPIVANPSAIFEPSNVNMP